MVSGKFTRGSISGQSQDVLDFKNEDCDVLCIPSSVSVQGEAFIAYGCQLGRATRSWATSWPRCASLGLVLLKTGLRPEIWSTEQLRPAVCTYFAELA
ncbi:unnamed protein product [Phytophthora fragariaefolia]|uniref:Unnamed protein product n=1 Tax=Phytophthora fragariaefolia TaxID=1490495 RepID=A0A9W6Y831_9STRA|nr:unnamed protein product [Phytophthora fragariaefolia]